MFVNNANLFGEPRKIPTAENFRNNFHKYFIFFFVMTLQTSSYRLPLLAYGHMVLDWWLAKPLSSLLASQPAELSTMKGFQYYLL